MSKQSKIKKRKHKIRQRRHEANIKKEMYRINEEEIEKYYKPIREARIQKEARALLQCIIFSIMVMTLFTCLTILIVLENIGW